MTAPNLFMDVDGQYLGRDFKFIKLTVSRTTQSSPSGTRFAPRTLYTIIDQKRTSDFIRTFLAQYEQGGRLPVWSWQQMKLTR